MANERPTQSQHGSRRREKKNINVIHLHENECSYTRWIELKMVSIEQRRDCTEMTNEHTATLSTASEWNQIREYLSRSEWAWMEKSEQWISTSNTASTIKMMMVFAWLCPKVFDVPECITRLFSLRSTLLFPFNPVFGRLFHSTGRL